MLAVLVSATSTAYKRRRSTNNLLDNHSFAPILTEGIHSNPRRTDSWDPTWRKLYEPALFILADGPVLLGILITHVDDLYAAGEGKKYNETIASMEKLLHLTVKKGESRFCGKNVKQDSERVSLNQMDAIEAIGCMVLPGHRRKSPSSPLTEAEKTSFRGLIGQFGWVARQTRPDLMVNVSVAAQSMGNPTIKDVVELNKAVCHLELCEAPGARPGQCCGVLFRRQFSRQPGRVEVAVRLRCGLHHGEDPGGRPDTNPYRRGLLWEQPRRLHEGAVSMKELDEIYLKNTLCFTDAKSLEQILNKDTGAPQDKRVRILIAQIKEMIGENDYNDDSPSYAYWVDTSQMLADVLTKLGCERDPLLRALCDGEWQLQQSSEARDRKLAIRAGRHARKAKARAAP